VTAPFVGDMRRGYRTRPAGKGASVNKLQMADRKVQRNGTVYTQRTENIGRRPVADRIEQVRQLAEEGNRASQIASALGLSEQSARKYAAAADIELPDKAIGKVRKIDSRRVIEQPVLGLEASAQSLNTTPVSFDGIDQDEA